MIGSADNIVANSIGTNLMALRELAGPLTS